MTTDEGKQIQFRNLTRVEAGHRQTLAEEIRAFEEEVGGAASSPAARALILAAAGIFADLRRHARRVAGRKKSKALSGREMGGLDALRAVLLGAGLLELPKATPEGQTPQDAANVANVQRPIRLPAWEKPKNCACVPGSGTLCPACSASHKEWERIHRSLNP